MSLLDVPLPELMAMARDARDCISGTRVTYSPKIFIPLTELWRDALLGLVVQTDRSDQVTANTGSVAPFIANAVLRIMHGPQLPQWARPLS